MTKSVQRYKPFSCPHSTYLHLKRAVDHFPLLFHRGFIIIFTYWKTTCNCVMTTVFVVADPTIINKAAVSEIRLISSLGSSG